jgi:gas vesicle protein
MGTNSSVGTFFSGFLIGGLVSAAAALLLAPQSGKETRTQIRDKGIGLRDKAETTYVNLHEGVETAVADLRDIVDELSAKVDQAIAQGREVFSQETVDLVEQTGPDEEPVAQEAVARI